MPVQDRHLALSARATALRRVTSVATLALVSALVVGPLPVRHPAAAAAACEEVQQRGSWTSITEIPGHEAQNPNSTNISEWAVHPTDPNVFYVAVPDRGESDETQPGILEGSLLRSTDGGCSWEEILTDDDLNPPLAGATEDVRSPRRVDAVEVAADGTIYVSVFLHSGSGFGGVSFESVWISRDRGANWERTTEGLPVIAEGCVDARVSETCPVARADVRFYPAPSDPRTVYLLTGPSPGQHSDVYATTNGGKSWEARTVLAETPPQETYVDDCVIVHSALPPQGPCTDSGLNGEYRPADHMEFQLMTGLIVDPVNSQELWALRIEETEAERNERRAKEGVNSNDAIGPRLVHSTNGGARWSRIPVRGHTIPDWSDNLDFPGGAMLSVFHKPGEPAHLFITADWESFVPDDQGCGNCARSIDAYSILTSANNGESWTSLARVEIPENFSALFLGTGSASPQNMVLAYKGFNRTGPDHARVHRYDKRSGSWVEVSPDHLHLADGDWWGQLDRADVTMVRSGKDTYLVGEYSYSSEEGFEVSIQKYLLPRR